MSTSVSLPEARAAADLQRYEAWVRHEVDREIVPGYGSYLNRQLNQEKTTSRPADRAAMSRDQQFARRRAAPPVIVSPANDGRRSPDEHQCKALPTSARVRLLSLRWLPGLRIINCGLPAYA